MGTDYTYGRPGRPCAVRCGSRVGTCGGLPHTHGRPGRPCTSTVRATPGGVLNYTTDDRRAHGRLRRPLLRVSSVTQLMTVAHTAVQDGHSRECPPSHI